MHFVTICDSDDSGSGSDSDVSHENGSLVVGSPSNDAAASLPADNVPVAVSITSADISVVSDLGSTSDKECCTVRHSPVLSNAVNSLPTTSSARSLAVQPSSAGHCQYVGKS